VRPLFAGRRRIFILGVECELIVDVTFRLEDESMLKDETLQDTFLQYYMGFSEEFAAAGFGQCGPPLILLPRTVDAEGVELFIPGTFEFNCNVTLSQVEPALGQIRKSFSDMNPKPSVSVKLYERESHSRISLYPHSDIENYLSEK
jgi:hypothetical protein